MTDMHVPMELVRAIARGERNPGDLAPVVIAHLRALCPTCATALDLLDRERAEAGEPLILDYGEAYEQAMELARLDAEVLEREKTRAKPRLAALLAMNPQERLAAIEAGSDFRGSVLAGLLLEESRSHLPAGAEAAYAMAQLAKTVLLRSEVTPVSVALYARTLSHLGNARRGQGSLREAADLFDHARFLLRTEGGGDRMTRAEIDTFEGSLRRAQRRLGEASELLSRAIAAYRLEGLAREEAEALLRLSMVYREQSEIEKALAVTWEALKVIDPQKQPRLYLMARHNLADRLTELGRASEAREIVEESFDLYQQFPDPWTQLRRLWVEAKIARGLGEVEDAEQALLAVRDGFLRQGVGFDAALASLDLALLYLDQGKTVEVKRLAEEMVPIFEAQDVHREAAAALMLFQEAVSREQITIAFVNEVFRFLEAARMDPELTFSA